jgi:hypothetical protein
LQRIHDTSVTAGARCQAQRAKVATASLGDVIRKAASGDDKRGTEVMTAKEIAEAQKAVLVEVLSRRHASLNGEIGFRQRHGRGGFD